MAPETRDLERDLLRERFAMRSLLEFARTLTPDLGVQGIIRSVQRTVMGKGLITESFAYLENQEAGKFEFVNKIGFRKLDLPPEISFEEFERWSTKTPEGVAFVMPILDSDQEEIVAFIAFGYSLSPTVDIEDEPNYLESLSLLTGIALTNARLFKIEKERERYQAQLELAREIQQSLLPQELPKIQGLSLVAYSKQSELVGGDYYDALELGEKKVLLVVADVVGKGIGAAILMSNLQAGIHTVVSGLRAERIDLLTATNELNRLVYESTTAERYITAVLAIIDLDKEMLTAIVCGHPRPLLFSGGAPVSIPTSGVPLGVLKDAKFEPTEISFTSGAKLVLFSDGLSEAVNKQGGMLGEEGVQNFIQSLGANISAESLAVGLDENSSFTINDDLTLLVALSS
jgi:sigma-B regulation protein RsbU (phosphoserine phosphatase)